MPKKDGSLTKMEKRDIRDAFGLVISTIGTAVSVASIAIALSPRSDPRGLELARDLKSYLDSEGAGGWGLMDLHRSMCSPEAVDLLIGALDEMPDGPGRRAMLRRLKARRKALG